MFRSVRDGDMRPICAGLLEEFSRVIMEDERGCTRCLRDDFDILPREAARPTRAESFERGFFRGETRGIMLWGDDAAPVAVITLLRREDTLDETRRALERRLDATNFDDVDADGDDHD